MNALYRSAYETIFRTILVIQSCLAVLNAERPTTTRGGPLQWRRILVNFMKILFIVIWQFLACGYRKMKAHLLSME